MGCGFPAPTLTIASIDVPTLVAPALPKAPPIAIFIAFGLPVPTPVSLASIDVPSATPPVLPKAPPIPPIDASIPAPPPLVLASIDVPTLTPPKLPIMPSIACPFDDAGGQ